MLTLLPITALAATTRTASTAAELSAAFIAAASGDTIKLTANITLSSGIYTEKTLTLDLNGFTLTGPNTFQPIDLGEYGELVITDTSAAKNGKITASTNSSTIYLMDFGTLTVNSGTVENTGVGKTIWNGGNCGINISGGTVSCASPSEAAIYNTRTTKITVSGSDRDK